MTSAKLVLMVLAFLCELLAVFNVPKDERVNMVAAGLACWFASILFPY
jgi:hypothetical protein